MALSTGRRANISTFSLCEIKNCNQNSLLFCKHEFERRWKDNSFEEHMNAHTHTHVVDGITKSSEPLQIRGGWGELSPTQGVCVCALEQAALGSFSDTLSAEN